MAVIAKRARANLAWWDHVSGGTHWPWERLGQLFDGQFGWQPTIPEACHTTHVPHSAGLTDPAIWDRYALWRFLR